MEITTTANDGTARIRLDGRIDALEAPKLRDELERHIGSKVDIVVDLLDVEFIDSSGLATLVKAWRHHTGAGGSLTVALPVAETARRVFDLTGFDQVFEIVGAAEARPEADTAEVAS